MHLFIKSLFQNIHTHVICRQKVSFCKSFVILCCDLMYILERDPAGVSLGGKLTNCLTYISIPRYFSQQQLGVGRVDGGGCGQGGHRNGVSKMG